MIGNGESRTTSRFDFFDEKIDEAFVEVVAAEAGVAIGGKDLKDTFVQFENGKIEGAATEVIDGNSRAFFEFIEAVGERGSGGFVNDALDCKASEFACAFGGVALGIVEIGGDGDNSTIYGIAIISFSIAHELFQDFR